MNFLRDFLVFGEERTHLLLTTVWISGNSILWQAYPSSIFDFLDFLTHLRRSVFSLFYSCLMIFLLDVKVFIITILGILLLRCGSEEILIFFLNLLWQ